jgi:myo-inositol catabolism protein IolC
VGPSDAGGRSTRAGGDPMGQRHEVPLMIMAADHRSSLESGLYGIEGSAGPLESARIAKGKLILFEALLDAAAALKDRGRPGILIDEQHGASAALIAAESPEIDLSMPIEASGQQWFRLAYPGHWQRHAEFFTTDHAEILIRDHPGLDPDARARQAKALAVVSKWAAGVGKGLIIELLVPAGGEDLRSVGGDVARYDAELRPRLTNEVIVYLQDHGVEPTLWKVEGLDARKDAERLVETVRRDGREINCIVLGRNAPPERLEHWLGIAASVDGFVGFAIGRTIWWDPLRRHVVGAAGEPETKGRITANYLRYAEHYLSSLGSDSDRA